jgi:hypothetical protein
MAKNTLDLTAKMGRVKKSVSLAASNIAVDVAKTITGDLAFRTPVDTSRALSNWIVTLGKESAKRIDPHVWGIGGSTHHESAAETYSAAVVVLAKKKPSQPIYISNNVDYINELNEHHSQAGFVERAVLLGRKTASKKLKGA